MFQAAEPKTLTDVRPQVTSMRHSGYFLQTDGSATKKVVEPEGDDTRKIYRVTGIPGHTHTSSAILEIEVTKKTLSDQPVLISNAVEFSIDDLRVAGEDLDDNESRDTYNDLIERAQRSIEFGVGNVQLQPENCKSYIDEPTRAIAELRTLVSPQFAQKASTYIHTEYLRTQRDGTAVSEQMPTVYVPIMPINNLHIDSKAGMKRAMIEGHLEFWREDQNFNDWALNGEQISHKTRSRTVGGNAVAAIPYPVAIGRIGTTVPIFLLDEQGREERWDGTLPFDYDRITNNYVLRKRAYKLKFSPPFDFVSNGHFTRAQLTGGTTAQRKKINVSEEGEFIIFTLDTSPSNWKVTFKNGYYYLNYDVKYSSRTTLRVYKKPRILIKGTFSMLGAELSTLVKGDGAGGQQDSVAQNEFGQDYLCAYHAPLVRWAAGTNVAVQGPLMNDIFLPALLLNGDEVPASVGVEFPTDAGLHNYSSMWETMKKSSLLDGQDLRLIRTAEELELLLQMFPSFETKKKADGTSNTAVVQQVKFITYPVPFAAGMYPFREDYRFRHTAAIDVASLGDINVDSITSMSQALYKPRIVDADDEEFVRPSLSDVGLVKCVYTYANADKTEESNGAKAVFDAFRDKFQLNKTKVGTIVRKTDSESQYESDYIAGIIGQDQICGSILVHAIVTPFNEADTVHAYPCEFLSSSIRTYPEVVNGDDPANRDLSLTIQVNQTLFKQIFKNVDFRGLSVTETRAQGDDLETLPAAVPQSTHFDVGNVFFYGSSQDTETDNAKYNPIRGGSFSVETGQVQMFVTITKITDHSATLRVHGLCVDPVLANNYIVFYFGGTAGNPNHNDARRILYISEPGAYRSFNGTVNGTNATGVHKKQFYTDFFVTSPQVIENVAETQLKADTELDDANNTRSLCVGVIAARCTGMFRKDTSSDYFHPDRENQLTLLEVSSKSKGTIWNPKIRISQYLTAPLISPDKSNQCISPLDQSTGFLPPEMRDFKMVLGDFDWSRLGTDYNIEIKNLTFSNFDGGNQQVAALPSLLSVPEFQIHKLDNVSGNFHLEIFTAQGPPCFWSVFARSTESPNWGQQPFINSLSFKCLTTGKQSNTIWETSDSELYFYTSRNTHFQSGYTASAFNERQVVLLRSEDVGTMGINPVFYQNDKRTKYQITGNVSSSVLWEDTVDLTVVLIYINRGLHIQGKELTLRYL